jgi:hypothetical protein
MFVVEYRLDWDGVSGPQGTYNATFVGRAERLSDLPVVGDDIALGGPIMRQVYKRRVILNNDCDIVTVVIRADSHEAIIRRERKKRRPVGARPDGR